MTGIETACEVLGERGGQKAVAETLGVSVRAVFDKRHGNTSISDFEVRILVSTNLLAEIGALPAGHPVASKGPTA